MTNAPKPSTSLAAAANALRAGRGVLRRVLAADRLDLAVAAWPVVAA